MPMPGQTRDFDILLTVPSTATISAGFTVCVASPTRGEIIGVYICPVDGTAITAGTTATLTLTVANVAGATVTCSPSAIGIASGTTIASGATLSQRQFVNEGEVIKAVLGTGIVNTANAIVTFVIRARSI